MGDLLSEATEHYLESGEFNGLPLHILGEVSPEFEAEVRRELDRHLKKGAVVIRTSRWGNPYIRLFSSDDPKAMRADAASAPLQDIVVYPSAKHLRRHAKKFAQEGPYTQELALGGGQLDFKAFDLSVLEWYRNDPRYTYFTADRGGSIDLRDEYFQRDEEVLPRDQVFLKTFGFCFDDKMTRAVAVYLVYLHHLSAEHQQVWKARELPGEFRLHPDYAGSSLRGEWPQKASVFEAFLEELQIINKMAEAMGRPALFRHDFSGDRPKAFGFLVRPTLAEFQAFAQQLDKMLSDNINKKFFKGEVAGETEEKRKDGRVVVKPAGTLAMLKSWLSKFFFSDDPHLDAMHTAFKKVRDLRNRPSHTNDPDRFDRALVEEQRQLMFRAYGALKTLRLTLALHPAVAAADIRVSDFVRDGTIWPF